MTEDLETLVITEPELARLLGISAQGVAKARRDGKLTSITKKKPFKYILGDVIKEDRSRLKAEAAGRISATDDLEDDQLDPIQTSARLRYTQNQILELKLAEARGEVTNLKTVVAAFEAVCTVARQRILGLPKTLAARLHGLSSSDIAALDESVIQILEDLSSDASRIPEQLQKAALDDAAKQAGEAK